MWEDDNISSTECESDCKDYLLEDDVQSDTEDELNDEIVDVQDSYAEDQSVSITNSTSSSDTRIIIPFQRILRGKNKHCWATKKGKIHHRTSAINIV